MEIEFVSYDGKYPCLCMGNLILKVDGTNITFKGILASGGTCGFRNDFSEEVVTHGRWEVDEDNLPENLVPYVDKITKLVNENIPYGCCGGCL